jgi:hypothetical protein
VKNQGLPGILKVEWVFSYPIYLTWSLGVWKPRNISPQEPRPQIHKLRELKDPNYSNCIWHYYKYSKDILEYMGRCE